MTDQHTPDLSQGSYTLDDVWLASDWASHILKTPGSSIPMERSAARVLQALLPPPSRPTLADMTPEERRECQWMQADTKTWGRVVIAVPTLSGARASLLDRWGDGAYEDHANVTPRPDLPRLEWPGTEKPAPAPALPEGWRLADHPRYGRVFVTTPEPDGDGDLWFIDPSADLGSMEHWCDPDVLTFLDDQGADQ